MNLAALMNLISDEQTEDLINAFNEVAEDTDFEMVDIVLLELFICDDEAAVYCNFVLTDGEHDYIIEDVLPVDIETGEIYFC